MLELVLKFEKVCIIVLVPAAFGSRQGRQAFATDQHNPTHFSTMILDLETGCETISTVGCHVDTTLINMHETPKVSTEGHGFPSRMAAEAEGYT